MIIDSSDPTIKSTAIDSIPVTIGTFTRLYCIRVTTAPMRYDATSCLTLYKCSSWRIVLIPAEALVWQIDRYHSGLYVAGLLKDIGVEQEHVIPAFAESVFEGKMDVVTEEEGDKT